MLVRLNKPPVASGFSLASGCCGFSAVSFFEYGFSAISSSFAEGLEDSICEGSYVAPTDFRLIGYLISLRLGFLI